MTDDMISEHLARAHLAESVTMDAETWTEVLQELQRYRQAIHQAEQAQPVAWMWKDGTITADPDRADGTWTPLYTAPPQRKLLTDEELDTAITQERDDLLDHIYEYTTVAEGIIERVRKLARRAIEAAHGIKE